MYISSNDMKLVGEVEELQHGVISVPSDASRWIGRGSGMTGSCYDTYRAMQDLIPGNAVHSSTGPVSFLFSGTFLMVSWLCFSFPKKSGAGITVFFSGAQKQSKSCKYSVPCVMEQNATSREVLLLLYHNIPEGKVGMR